MEKKNTEEEKQKSRAGGNTVITSVSVSKAFRELIDRFDISPTNALRKGVAIELFERGLPQYQSDTNRERFEAVKKYLAESAVEDIPSALKEFEQAAKKLRVLLEMVE